MSLSTSDITQKPPECVSCPFHTYGTGFVPDSVPSVEPKAAFLFEAPGGTEIIDRELGSDGASKIFTKMLGRAGWTRGDVIISTVISCNPPNNRYPIGELRKQAEKACFRWRKALDKYNPDYFLITINPRDCLTSWPRTRMLRASFDTPMNMGDLEKAVRLASSGKRLLVCMGDKAKEYIFPSMYPGSALRWRGHHGQLNWSKIKERYESIL